jgi:mRNA interferase RelE/StbE
MSYQIEFTPAAQRDLAKLPTNVREAMGPVIAALAGDPRPPRARLLVNSRGLWRVKAGDYRVLYRIEDKRLVVLLVKVAHRREAYRQIGQL